MPITHATGFAGSAIAQGSYVGRIDLWSHWKPTTAVSQWLLLAGASNPPENVHVSRRRPRNSAQDRSGTFLAGVAHDIPNMQDAILKHEAKIYNMVINLQLKKCEALEHISKLFYICKRNETKPMLYYTGHGEIGTGNWCFNDGTVSIQEIFDMMPGGVYYPMIFSDACYNGHWADFCTEKNITGFHCLSACPDYSTATDTRGEGGDFTLFMTGKKARPCTEPMYSGGNLRDYPVSSGFNLVDYTDFISSYVISSERILISQSMHDGYFCGSFAPSKLYNPRAALAWGMRNNYDTFLEFVKEKWKWINGKSKQIDSLACDEKFGFGVFFMENYGTNQTILIDTSSIQRKWDDGFEITACAARGSTFYIIMTKDTKEYKGKPQSWFTRNTWNDTRAEIQEGYDQGNAITGICYSSGLGQYFVVMTEMPEGQCYHWSDLSTKEERTGNDKWMDEKYKEGFLPTIVFKDPTDKKILIVMSKDENRLPGWLCTYNYKLR